MVVEKIAMVDTLVLPLCYVMVASNDRIHTLRVKRWKAVGEKFSGVCARTVLATKITFLSLFVCCSSYMKREHAVYAHYPCLPEYGNIIWLGLKTKQQQLR